MYRVLQLEVVRRADKDKTGILQQDGLPGKAVFVDICREVLHIPSQTFGDTLQ